jgi:putative flippase GtrA
MSPASDKNNAAKKETAIQFAKNFLMGFVVTILESVSLNPMLKLFGLTPLPEKYVLLVANATTVIIYFFVRFFVNYFWVFHSKRSIIRILPLFAVLIVVFTLTTTKMIEGFVFLLNLSAPVAETLGEDNIITISKFTATFIMGLVNFAICKKFIFKDEADGKA